MGAVLDAQAERELERLAELLGRCARALVLTGAGVSTESGLPDYRGAHGLWRNRRFEELASIEAWRSEPEEFWSFYRERLAALRGAEPNAGHLAIAELERRGLVDRVITQNVDGLHRRAGSVAPLEVHGTLAEVECLGCGWRGPSRLADEQLAGGARTATCPSCRAVLKPAVVLFGELLPPAFEEASRLVLSCDLLLCCGSSLQVSPVSSLPVWARAAGAALAIVNLGPTAHDDGADVRVEAAAGVALPRLLELVPPAGRRRTGRP